MAVGPHCLPPLASSGLCGQQCLRPQSAGHQRRSLLVRDQAAHVPCQTDASPWLGELPNSIFGTPGSLRLSPSLPTPYERGECPSWHFPRRCPRGILVLRVPFPWATRAYYTNSVPWTHGLFWPTISVPGVPSTQCAHFTSHAPSRSIASYTLQKVSCLRSIPTTNRHPLG